MNPQTIRIVEFWCAVVGALVTVSWIVCQVIYGGRHLQECWLSSGGISMDMGVFTLIQGVTQLTLLVAMFWWIVTSSFGIVPLTVYMLNMVFQVVYISVEAFFVYTSETQCGVDHASIFRYLKVATPLNIVYAFMISVLSLVIVYLNRKNLTSFRELNNAFQ